jgi:hypothetical protein
MYAGVPIRRAVALAGLGHADAAGDAPVHQADLAVAADHDVLGLDVAVDDAALVGVVEGLEHGDHQLGAALEGPEGGVAGRRRRGGR